MMKLVCVRVRRKKRSEIWRSDMHDGIQTVYAHGVFLHALHVSSWRLSGRLTLRFSRFRILCSTTVIACRSGVTLALSTRPLSAVAAPAGFSILTLAADGILFLRPRAERMRSMCTRDDRAFSRKLSSSAHGSGSERPAAMCGGETCGTRLAGNWTRSTLMYCVLRNADTALSNARRLCWLVCISGRAGFGQETEEIRAARPTICRRRARFTQS